MKLFPRISTDCLFIKMATYIAQLIAPEGIRQTLEFEAANDSAAAQATNDDLDPLNGLWASVQRKPDPQQDLAFEYPDMR